MIARSLRGAVVTATFLVAVASEARPAVIFDGVAAGDVTSTDAILWARADNGGSTTRLTAQIATDPGFTNIVSALDGTTTAASDFTLKLDATGLTSNTRYYFHFVTPDGIASPTGQFTTAPMASEKVDVRFGFSGDADGRFRPYPSIANIASQKLNYFIFLGDTMYETPDAGSPAVPTITGETTDPASLAKALTAYNQKYS
jgi:alkaline phosphatase D